MLRVEILGGTQDRQGHAGPQDLGQAVSAKRLAEIGPRTVVGVALLGHGYLLAPGVTAHGEPVLTLLGGVTSCWPWYRLSISGWPYGRLVGWSSLEMASCATGWPTRYTTGNGAK